MNMNSGQKENEKIITKEDKKLAVFNSINEMIYISDPITFELLYVNFVLEDMFGDIVGQKCHKIFQGLDTPCPFCSNDIIFKEKMGQTYVWEHLNRINDNWYCCIDRVIKWHDGRLVRYEMAIDISELKKNGVKLQETFNELEKQVEKRTQDLFEANNLLKKEITVRKETQIELKKTMVELERSNKELQQFAYVASHDLQEPLRMVVSFLQLLSKRYEGKLDKDADEFIGFAVDGAVRMQRLIQDLLTYSRVNANEGEYKRVGLNTILGQVRFNLEKMISENSAILITQDLPQIVCDETLMVRLLQNLIENAIKYRREELPYILVSAKEQEDEWIFSVQDNGIGIEKQYYERIFEIFQRLHGKNEYPGTGIGLAVCHKIIERHNGRIWIESELGKGSTFYFAIPKENEEIRVG